MARDLDRTDWEIIGELQRDARQSFNRLSARVRLSAPAVAERVRRLESMGVITGYEAVVDPAAVGLTLSAFVHLRCAPGMCLLKTSRSDDFPEIAEIHKLTGTSCSLLKIRATSMEHLDGLLERIAAHGRIDSHVVLSTHFDRRPVEEPPAEPPAATRHEGWMTPPDR